jgi:quinol monooxygenase YgiN
VLSVTLAVSPGQAPAFSAAVASLVESVAANAPEVLFYKFFLSEDGLTARAIQVHADSAALEQHITSNPGAIAEVLRYAELVSTELLGDPTDAVLARIAAYRSCQVVRAVAGFSRYSPK